MNAPPLCLRGAGFSCATLYSYICVTAVDSDHISGRGSVTSWWSGDAAPCVIAVISVVDKATAVRCCFDSSSSSVGGPRNLHRYTSSLGVRCDTVVTRSHTPTRAPQTLLTPTYVVKSSSRIINKTVISKVVISPIKPFALRRPRHRSLW